jgi:hypothetical protein
MAKRGARSTDVIERCGAHGVGRRDYLGATCNVYACGEKADCVLEVGGGTEQSTSSTAVRLCPQHARRMAISLVAHVCRVRRE